MGPAAIINCDFGKHHEHPGGERLAAALKAVPVSGPSHPRYSVYRDGVCGPGIGNTKAYQVQTEQALAAMLNCAYVHGVISAQHGELRCKDCDAAHLDYRADESRNDSAPGDDDERFDCVEPH